LSFIISDWFTPGYNGLPASLCTPEQIMAEMATQVNLVYPNLLNPSNIYSWYIDEDIVYFDPTDGKTSSNAYISPYAATYRGGVRKGGAPLRPNSNQKAPPGKSKGARPPTITIPEKDKDWHPITSGGIIRTSSMMSDAEPLMINEAYSWWDRPDGPWTALSNLFLSGDYIKTDFQLACAEGANESGKYAVNAILVAGCHVRQALHLGVFLWCDGRWQRCRARANLQLHLSRDHPALTEVCGLPVLESESRERPAVLAAGSRVPDGGPGEKVPVCSQALNSIHARPLPPASTRFRGAVLLLSDWSLHLSKRETTAERCHIHQEFYGILHVVVFYTKEKTSCHDQAHTAP